MSDFQDFSQDFNQKFEKVSFKFSCFQDLSNILVVPLCHMFSSESEKCMLCSVYICNVVQMSLGPPVTLVWMSLNHPVFLAWQQVSVGDSILSVSTAEVHHQ